jgi:hypothetical protein
MREERSWELFAKNSALSLLTSAQKTQLQSYMEVLPTQVGDELWSANAAAEAAFLVDEGSVALEGYAEGLQPFGSAAFLGEVEAITQGGATTGSARVVEAGQVFRVARRDLVEWFDENPGLHLTFLGTRAVE